MSKSAQRKNADRPNRRNAKRDRREYLDDAETVVKFPQQRPRLEYRTEAQGHYHQAMQTHLLTVGEGPAGTGKTLVATMNGARLLDEKRIARLILTRPAVEVGRSIGFLKGNAAEKTEMYFRPFKDVLNHYFGETHVEYLVKRGYIEMAPLGFQRGTTFEDAFVIIDEAQNTTVTEMKMLLTRMGENCRFVVNGDITQKDIKEYSGLEHILSRLDGMPETLIYRFEEEDIVRSAFVRELMKRWKN